MAAACKKVGESKRKRHGIKYRGRKIEGERGKV